MGRRRGGALAALAGVVVLTAAAMRGRLRRYAIVERSMEPALRPGDWIVARRVGGPHRRGAVVVFDHPEQPGMELVKRIVGLPGERVEVANGQVHIDGSTLAEPWADGPTRPDGRWELAADEVFVLGDARARSTGDSRTVGPLPAGAAAWQVVGRYWPPRAVGRI